MGIMPSEVKRMTVWELTAVMNCWMEAHDSGGDHRLSDADKDEIWEWMQTQPKGPLTHRKNGHG